jgi:methylase of polypeptide subunit release factors
VGSAHVEQLLDVLGYAGSPNYRATDGRHDPLTAHLFRAAHTAGAEGAYVFHTSPDDKILPVRPAVYIAEAKTEDEAREIHRSLWNLGNAPFLIILLPHQVRVYTGFDYARPGAKKRGDERGLIDIIDLLMTVDLHQAMADYTADSIDSGRLWKNQGEHLIPERRVDAQLLKNLKKLEEELVKDNLELTTAHALIGKYVYIRYLYDRKILSSQWLDENHIDIDSVLGRGARLRGLRRLVEALDERFNGHIFPFPLSGKGAPTDEQVSLVASAFKGDDPALRQMHLDFEPFDFSYIPIETLSSIYEQFLHAQGTGKGVGAIYTPEPLADYLIAELNYAKPLELGMKVLDPCCGSGIFLVLAYRKLIELELSNRPDGKMRPAELRQILTESIYGVERNPDACFVAELSLILTMLHYISPPDLHRNKQFKFPDLHNKRIFESDFFDNSSEFWQKGEQFDWILGNPPWIEPEKDSEDEQLVLAWISENRRHRPVAGNRVSEAFSWRITDLVKPDGCAGMILHATSLFNHESKKYRQEFFSQQEVLRITNFTNLSYVLFSGRGEAPAATVIYCRSHQDEEKAPIVHYGPFLINQVISRPWQESKRKETWILTVNEGEIQTISADEAKTGDSVTWKLALWGSHRDKRALQRLRRLFTTTLEDLVQARGWQLHEGVRLMTCPPSGEEIKYEVEPAPDLRGQKFFDAKTMIKSGLRFSVPKRALQDIPDSLCFIRKRTGKASLKGDKAAHLIFNAAYFVYSDQNFIIRSPDKRLSVPLEDADELRALSVFFSSSIVQYYLFFRSPAWGVDRNRIYARDIKQIPVPSFTQRQVAGLAKLHKDLVAREISARESADALQDDLDAAVERILNVPKNLNTLAKDFMSVRLSLNKGRVMGVANRPPRQETLHEYGLLLRDELDEYTKHQVRHRVSLTHIPGQEFVVCMVELTNAASALEVKVNVADSHLQLSLDEVSQLLKQRFSQWAYVKRGLRIFEDSKVYICKAPRTIDWTKTQALNDSDDLIAEALSGNNNNIEVALDGAR